MESVNIQEQRPLKLQFNALDKKADQLVYQLYSLTPEEIAIVEYYAGI
jgi:hypothetical protein